MRNSRWEVSNQKGFLSFLGLLIVLVIIGWLAVKLLNTYYAKSPALNPSQSPVSSFFPEENVGPSAPVRGTIVDDVRARLQNAQAGMAQRLRESQENQ